MGKNEILGPTEFAVVKEYLEAEATISGISTVTGLSQKVIRDIQQAPHYKSYLENLKKVHRQKISDDTGQVQSMDKDLQQVLINLSEAIVGMTSQWESMQEKLDLVLEAKKPWLGRVPRF